MPNIAAECLLAALRFGALWTVFRLLHRPRTPLRRVLAIGVMALQYPLCRILFFASGGSFAASVAGDTVLFLTLALICEAEPAPRVSGAASLAGDSLLPPLVSALYFDGMLQLVNYIMSCYMYAFAGTLPPSFSLWSYFWKTTEGLLLLFWALFYCRIARNMAAKAPFAKAPLSFSLLTVLTPLAGLAVIAASTGAVRPLLDSGVNIFLYGGLFGTLIIVLNMCVFYLYIKLSVTHEALVFARGRSPSPPVRTPEQGLSAAFIAKYEITPREREVIEALLQGKVDKEIAVKLNMAVNTVQAHLKKIYRKTGAAGRFALSALVRGMPPAGGENPSGFSSCPCRSAPAGGENPSGFSSLLETCPFIRESAGWQAEHRNAAAVLGIYDAPLHGGPFERARNAAAMRCSACRGRCRIEAG